jgi:hypothetical protein
MTSWHLQSRLSPCPVELANDCLLRRHRHNAETARDEYSHHAAMPTNFYRRTSSVFGELELQSLISSLGASSPHVATLIITIKTVYYLFV